MDYRQFFVAATAIVRRPSYSGGLQYDYLLTKRSPNKKHYPNLWTVPGGHVENQDYSPYEEMTYSVKNAIRREVYEETGVSIKNLKYVTSLALKGEVIVVSMVADYAGGEVMLDPNEAVEYRWVTIAEAKELPLIDGIFDELVLSARIS